LKRGDVRGECAKVVAHHPKFAAQLFELFVDLLELFVDLLELLVDLLELFVGSLRDSGLRVAQ
jgi:hypothetical protein